MGTLRWWKLFIISIGLFAKDTAQNEVEKGDQNVIHEVESDVLHTPAIIKEVERIGEQKHILIFHPWSTRSHMMQQTALLKGLLAKGHLVTGVFPFATNIEDDGYTEFVVEDVFGSIQKILTDSMMNKDSTGIWTWLNLLPTVTRTMNTKFEDLKSIQEMVIQDITSRNKSVDAIIITAQFAFTGIDIFDHYKCPIISMSPPGWANRITKFLGNSENPSYQPDPTLPFVEPMTFSQRLVNTLFNAMMDFEGLGGIWISLIAEKFDIPGYITVLENTSLMLLCSHFVTQSPRALTANTVEVGGIHCREGEKLPDDLQEFLDGHPEGVVYVSFGSSVKPSQMPAERKQVFLDTFRQLSHPVIWKWDEDDIPNLPANVKLSKWLPQQDLLAHPNLRVFVTHGGLLSVQEALYHRTPLVGIPLGNDQKPNLLRAEKRGYAIRLDWSSINTDQFLAAINRAMDDEELKENMKRMHKLFVDARDPPLDRAVWWVEYVIRHKGAQFLRPHSLDLAWYQYHLLDVIAFIVIFVSIVTFISIWCCMCCCRRFLFRKLKTE
eukprot:GFUD01028916.1.p1 GENE.GFUD01028916.1~~GFUD01028916.1.p1  ORF type:complete len:551 (-),score=119.39 GFUD01028916.1:114-1766(-)